MVEINDARQRAAREAFVKAARAGGLDWQYGKGLDNNPRVPEQSTEEPVAKVPETTVIFPSDTNVVDWPIQPNNEVPST